MTPDDPVGNAQELQAALDSESTVELAAGVWPCAPVHMPATPRHLIGYGATIRATGFDALEAWLYGEGAVAHVVEGVRVEGKGGAGVGFRPGSGWVLRDWSVSGMRAGVNVVDDKSTFDTFSVNKCAAGFLVGPTDKHAGGQILRGNGGMESCEVAFEVDRAGRIEAWIVEGVHLGNCGTAFGRTGGASEQGDPPLLIDSVFVRLGAERLGARYDDSGPAGIVGGNVWVGGNCSLAAAAVDVCDWRDDNAFLGTEAGQWAPDGMD